MRRYNYTLHSKLNTQNRNLQVVCPFPGRNPLRLKWRVYTEPFMEEEEGATPFKTVKYYGKFTASAWRQFRKTFYEALARHQRHMPVYGSWSLFDKAKLIYSGYSPVHMEETRNGYGPHRYFLNGLRRTLGNDPFQFLRPIKAGPYHLFCVDEQDPDPIALATYARYIATTIPHVRSV